MYKRSEFAHLMAQVCGGQLAGIEMENGFWPYIERRVKSGENTPQLQLDFTLSFVSSLLQKFRNGELTEEYLIKMAQEWDEGAKNLADREDQKEIEKWLWV